MYTFISMNASLLLGAYAKKDKKKTDHVTS